MLKSEDMTQKTKSEIRKILKEEAVASWEAGPGWGASPDNAMPFWYTVALTAAESEEIQTLARHTLDAAKAKIKDTLRREGKSECGRNLYWYDHRRFSFDMPQSVAEKTGLRRASVKAVEYDNTKTRYAGCWVDRLSVRAFTDNSSSFVLKCDKDGRYSVVVKLYPKAVPPVPEERRRRNWDRAAKRDEFVGNVFELYGKMIADGFVLKSFDYDDIYYFSDLKADKRFIFEKPAAAEPEPEPVAKRFPAVEPEKKDLDRISKLLDKYENDPPKLVEACELMNSKITDEAKRARRRAACVKLGFEWVADCFAA